MSFFLRGALATEPVAGPDSAELLLNLHGDVDFAGEAATFDVAFTNQHPFQATIPFVRMPDVFEEIRRTAQLMMARQRFHVDRGAAAMLDLMEDSPRPAAIEIFVEPFTLDRLFFIQFHDRPPLSVRISPADLRAALVDLAEKINREVN
jgi:hypothetical protein